MTDIMYQLYYGEIHPSAQFAKTKDRHLSKRHACVARHDAFLARLKAIDPALEKEMDQLIDEQLEADLLELPESFFEGFRLGMLLAWEVLGG